MTYQMDLTDVERIVCLVAEVGDPTVNLSLPERKLKLLQGLASIIDADAWLWSSASPNPESPGDIATTYLIDGGWRDEREQVLVYEALSDKKFASHATTKVTQAVIAGEYATFSRNELMTDEDWELHGGIWRKTGFEHILLTIYPFTPQSFSSIGLHRRAGTPPFTEREKSIVHVLFRQVDWLHRHGTNQPAGEKSVMLTPRERQVLVFILRGDTKKEIAAKLNLSEHTVGDYIKQLHKHFNVNSRAELQAVFLTAALPTAL